MGEEGKEEGNMPGGICLMRRCCALMGTLQKPRVTT